MPRIRAVEAGTGTHRLADHPGLADASQVWEGVQGEQLALGHGRAVCVAHVEAGAVLWLEGIAGRGVDVCDVYSQLQVSSHLNLVIYLSGC